MHKKYYLKKSFRSCVMTLWNVRIPVPFQSPCVMPVEEVWLGAQGANVRVEPQKLQQRPGASFFNPYDESLR